MTETQLLHGLKQSYNNASRLIEEADGLFIFERYSRSYTLYQLAHEEMGKSLIIFQAIFEIRNGVNIDKKYFEKKNFKDHKTKTKKVFKILFNVFETIAEKLENGEKILQEFRNKYESARKLDDKKNLSLYVSIDEKEKFKSPDDIITKDMTQELATLVKLSLLGLEKIHIQPLEVLEEISDKLINKITEADSEIDT